jgi:hypothetical protein
MFKVIDDFLDRIHKHWHCQRAWQNQFSWSRPFTKHKQGTFPEFKT